MLRSVLVAALLVAALSMAPSRLDAQEPGDFFWMFAPHGALADERIELAFILLIDTESTMTRAGIDAALFYGDPRGQEFKQELESSGVAGQEWPILLAAAGIDEPAQDLRISRPCRFWAPQADAADAGRIAVGEALGAELATALSRLGLPTEPCELVSDSSQADFYVWSFAMNLELGSEQPNPDADSFLQIVVDRPGAIPGGTGGIPNVTPPTTGDAGLR